MKITLSNVYPSYYNQEKSITNVSEYNSDLLKIENEIYQKKDLCDAQINRLNDEPSVKTEHLKTLNDAWMSIPYKKKTKKRRYRILANPHYKICNEHHRNWIYNMGAVQ
ncbi:MULTISPECIES: hypothetical protein [Symbiopectobacterium]|uniref:hypothetical protein n=1 Tax=Symbiopectobacterium TaxID=801 RepID=UPI001A1B36F0|nr:MULTISPECIES: hypothetical protein [Symbiopectobacterium]MBG6246850.1 hypothetical protein [Candidatus Symbiopectobacterium sp. PLON1]MBT9430197.1 hypothetical protein [Candidatus Symbiopectobacterium endolongispinus]